MGRDSRKLSHLFGDPRLPLYRAAADITPSPWRTMAVSSRRKAKGAAIAGLNPALDTQEPEKDPAD